MTAAALLRQLAQPALDAYQNTVTVTVPTRLLTALADQLEAAKSALLAKEHAEDFNMVPFDQCGRCQSALDTLDERLAEVERAAKEHTSQ